MERSSLQTLGEKCFRKSGLEEMRTPPSLREVGDKTFAGCKNLKRVVLNEGLETLASCRGAWAFHNSGLEEVVLPSTLREIHKGVFSCCRGLRTVFVVDGCQIDVSHYVDQSVAILSIRNIEQISTSSARAYGC